MTNERESKVTKDDKVEKEGQNISITEIKVEYIKKLMEKKNEKKKRRSIKRKIK